MKKQFIEHVHGHEYEIEGDFFLLEDGHFQIEIVMNGMRYIRKLEEMEWMISRTYYEDVRHDVAWMKLEDFYTDIMLDIMKDTDMIQPEV